MSIGFISIVFIAKYAHFTLVYPFFALKHQKTASKQLLDTPLFPVAGRSWRLVTSAEPSGLAKQLAIARARRGGGGRFGWRRRRQSDGGVVEHEGELSVGRRRRAARVEGGESGSMGTGARV